MKNKKCWGVAFYTALEAGWISVMGVQNLSEDVERIYPPPADGCDVTPHRLPLSDKGNAC